FPSEMADDPMLSYLLHEGDSFENAEERRVFYVAITRARYKNYLIYNESQPSKFLLELQAVAGNLLEQAVRKCPKCQGSLVRRKGPYSDFYGCVHYPRCNGRMWIPIAASVTPMI
ncbi:MAG: hypothetical protein JWM28_1598, partial [Chitinophagaceae bacterium]|nr:hypothetical protein [Chitinophagaceae bacterium]